MYPAGSFKHSELAAFEGFTTTELDQANFTEIDLFVPPPGFLRVRPLSKARGAVHIPRYCLQFHSIA